MAAEKITSFTKLIAWQKAHQLVVKIYTTTTSFPPHEIHSLTDQIRRSAVSISSNIAEGFGRSSQKEKVQFYSIALASLTELQNQLLIARDIGYLPVEKFRDLAEQTIEIGKILGGLKRSVKLTPN